MQRSTHSLKLEDHWRQWAKSNAGNVPGRTAFKPYDLPDLMPDVAIARLGSSRLKVLMAGTNITERLGTEITGLDYMTFVREDQRDMVMKVLRLVCHHPAGACLHMESAYSRGYLMQLEVTILPVTGEKTEDHMIIALTVPRPDVAATLASPFRGDPIGSDWHEPGAWIDLGQGIPPQAGYLQEVKVVI